VPLHTLLEYPHATENTETPICYKGRINYINVFHFEALSYMARAKARQTIYKKPVQAEAIKSRPMRGRGSSNNEEARRGGSEAVFFLQMNVNMLDISYDTLYETHVQQQHNIVSRLSTFSIIATNSKKHSRR